MTALGDLHLTVDRAWPWAARQSVGFMCEGKMFSVPVDSPFGSFLLGRLETQLLDEVKSWT